MARQLKVYGVNYDGRNRRVVAATSQAEAARLCGMSAYSFREFGCETGNAEEVELAMREPGAVWSRGYKLGSEWVLIAAPQQIDKGG